MVMKFDFLFKNKPEGKNPEEKKPEDVKKPEEVKKPEDMKDEVVKRTQTDGMLDMVIAFDTTGSMASYIDAVRKEVSELVPRLFKSNPKLRIGVVAFGDYCDMEDAHTFGKAYQCLMPTDNENDVIKFIMESKNTSGGDGDEFYELVLKKIIDETPWREDATKAVLLIADAAPHPVGYSYRDYVVGNQIDWREEARKAADRMIKVDTVTITDQQWYKELSAMTNGVSAPFSSSHKTARLVEAATLSRGSMESRAMFRKMADECEDTEVSAFMECYRTVCDSDEMAEDKAEK